MEHEKEVEMVHIDVVLTLSLVRRASLFFEHAATK